MDEEITTTPKISEEINELLDKADKTYWENFDGTTWFGRCIFLSWYCELGTCKFCFRSTQKHKISHSKNARRSLPSILSEAALIKGLGWRLEFITGGYGIYPMEELVKITSQCREIINDEVWLNLGVMKPHEISQFLPYVDGIVSSIETVNPELHKKVCPDKPIRDYVEMINNTKSNLKQSLTIIIGLGEKREDFQYLKEFINSYNPDRITIYTLRPVQGTEYTKGPSTEDLLWWIANTRIHFPQIEIIAGTAKYRIPEVSLILKAGANAITKLPATRIFNKEAGKEVEKEVEKAGRTFISKFTSKDPFEEYDWDNLINSLDMDANTKKEFKEKLYDYLQKMTH